MYDTFNLTNLIKSETFYTKNRKSLTDLLFTNKPLSFQKTHVTVRFNKENPKQYYDSLTTSFLEVVNRHAPLKKKIISGNRASFVKKDFCKAIYTRSGLRSKMCHNPISENNAYKKQRNKC